MGEGGGEMTHTMTEDEYSKYIEDMKDLTYLKEVEASYRERARGWFDKLESWFGGEKRCMHPEDLHRYLLGCTKEKSDRAGGYEYYCDFCPFVRILGCPFGYDVWFSK
jgi:hypothetical protein